MCLLQELGFSPCLNNFNYVSVLLKSAVIRGMPTVYVIKVNVFSIMTIVFAEKIVAYYPIYNSLFLLV